MQSSSPWLLGSPSFHGFHESVLSGTVVLDGLHTHVFSDSASVPPIHTMLPFAAVTSRSFSAADCTIANCQPFFWQSSLASLHDSVLFISVYGDGGGDGGGGVGGGEGEGGAGGEGEGGGDDPFVWQTYWILSEHVLSFHLPDHP